MKNLLISEKRIIISPIIGIFITLIGCVAWEQDVVLLDIHFNKFGYDSKLGSPKENLAADTVIQGYPCKKGYVNFYDEWNLNEFQLSQSIQLNKKVIIPWVIKWYIISGQPGSNPLA